MKRTKTVFILGLMVISLLVALSGCVVSFNAPTNITGLGWKAQWDAVKNGSTDISADCFYLKNESTTSIYDLKIYVGDNEPDSWIFDVTEDQLSNPLATGQTAKWDLVNDWNAAGLDTIWFKASSALDTNYVIGSFVYEDAYGWRLTVKD